MLFCLQNSELRHLIQIALIHNSKYISLLYYIFSVFVWSLGRKKLFLNIENAK
jgi:hypothetical protein